MNAAKVPLASEGRGQLTEAQTLLGQLEGSVDAVMDREEKRVLLRQLPHRSGAWVFKFETDKLTDDEVVRAFGSVDSSQAKYELTVSCRSRGPEMLVSIFESGGTAGKRIPWNIDSGHRRVRDHTSPDRLDPAFTAQLFMRGYGNQGQLDLKAEFHNLLRSSRLVLADVFPDEQVKIRSAIQLNLRDCVNF